MGPRLMLAAFFIAPSVQERKENYHEAYLIHGCPVGVLPSLFSHAENNPSGHKDSHNREDKYLRKDSKRSTLTRRGRS